MSKLIYAPITSLDGYIEDAAGAFDWVAPDDEVHGFINDLERSIGTYLYGRRMYETMVFWETVGGGGEGPTVGGEFTELWRAAEKVVYSRTLESVASQRTRIERNLDPDVIRRLKETSAQDISIGGADLAGQALSLGLVDECHLFLGPILVGGGKPALPRGVHARLELLGQQRFQCGVIHLHYRICT